MNLKIYLGVFLSLVIISHMASCEGIASEDITQEPVQTTVFYTESQKEEETLPAAEPILLNSLLSDEILKEYFQDFNQAAFVISNDHSSFIYNEAFAQTRQSPFSTFKILNTLIALEEGVIEKEESLKKWDGTIYSRAEINQDQDITSAFKNSCLWYYKELAKDIGEEEMNRCLSEIGYGNGDITGGIDNFWLNSTLIISPVEQADFIKNLYHNRLPFSKENMDFVKSIMKQENSTFSFYGKTGSSGNGMGWFTGFAEIDGNPYCFSAYIEGKGVSGSVVRNTVEQILEDIFVVN